MIGYRYIKQDGEIYIITLNCFNCFDDEIDGVISYYTTDCEIIKIINANTGNEAEKINAYGVMKKDQEYRKGEKIKGLKTYFCKTRVALYAYYLYRNKETGQITDISQNGEAVIPGIKEGVVIYYLRNTGQRLDSERKLFESYYSSIERKYFPDD